MKITTIDIVIPDDSKFIDILLYGDVHVGNKNHKKKLKKEILRYAKNNNSYIITGGDLIECAGRHSYGIEDQVMEVEDQLDITYKDLKPFADNGRLIGMIGGNHEKRAKREMRIDVTKLLARQLNTIYFGVSAVVVFRIRNKSSGRGSLYTMYMTHGKTRSSTLGGKINKCRKLSNIIRSEIYVMGHVHELVDFTETVYEIDRENLQYNIIQYIIIGGYLRYGDNYAEEAGYRPSGDKGNPFLRLYSRRHLKEVKIYDKITKTLK